MDIGETNTEEVQDVAMHQKVTVRLSRELIDLVDSPIKLGLASNRSEVMRKIVLIYKNLASPGGEELLSFILNLFSDPAEFFLYLNHRLGVMMMDGESRRRQAGLLTVFVKHWADRQGKSIDAAQLRDRFVQAMSSIDGLQAPTEPASGSKVVQDESVRGAFDALTARLEERIKSGARAEEVCAKVLALMVLADLYDERLGDVPPTLGLLARAGNLWDEEPQMDGDALIESFELWAMTIPSLYDNVDLRQEVKERLAAKCGWVA
jgi:hypothetical protein